MILNAGKVLERIVRRDRIGISELSRKLKVSRRTIYNWFDQEYLNPEIISKVGSVIGYDFSIEFPDNFSKNKNTNLETHDEQAEDALEADPNSIYFWMNKYIRLLEKYNELLSHTNNDSLHAEFETNHSLLRNHRKDKAIFPVKEIK